jgi:hypothetical protein
MDLKYFFKIFLQSENDIPVFRHSGVPAFRHSGVPAFRCSGIPVFRHSFFYYMPVIIEWIDIASTEYRYTAIRIPVNTGIPVFLTCFFCFANASTSTFQNQRFLFYRNFPFKNFAIYIFPIN